MYFHVEERNFLFNVAKYLQTALCFHDQYRSHHANIQPTPITFVFTVFIFVQFMYSKYIKYEITPDCTPLCLCRDWWLHQSSAEHESLWLLLSASPSHVTGGQQSAAGGWAECAMQNQKGAAFALECVGNLMKRGATTERRGKNWNSNINPTASVLIQYQPYYQIWQYLDRSAHTCQSVLCTYTLSCALDAIYWFELAFQMCNCFFFFL